MRCLWKSLNFYSTLEINIIQEPSQQTNSSMYRITNRYLHLLLNLGRLLHPHRPHPNARPHRSRPNPSACRRLGTLNRGSRVGQRPAAARRKFSRYECSSFCKRSIVLNRYRDLKENTTYMRVHNVYSIYCI